MVRLQQQLHEEFISVFSGDIRTLTTFFVFISFDNNRTRLDDWLFVPNLRPQDELAWNSSQREGSLELLFLWVRGNSPHVDVVIFVRLESDVDIFIVCANKFLRFDGFAKKGNDIRTLNNDISTLITSAVGNYSP